MFGKVCPHWSGSTPTAVVAAATEQAVVDSGVPPKRSGPAVTASTRSLVTAAHVHSQV